ncbi:MAG: tetratricopeptide repeat protein [Chloroflexota bacterium]
MCYTRFAIPEAVEQRMTGRQDLFEESLRLGHSAAWDLQWDRALEYYRKALAEFPDNPTALTSLGLALLETGQLKEALAAYHRAAKSSPGDPLPVEKCAEIFERLGQIKEAIEQHEAAAELYVRRRDAEKAVENWTHIARLAPNNLAARSRLALTYERLGRAKDALKEYLAVAAILQQAGKIDRAIESAQRALTLVPGDPEASSALAFLRQGRPLPTPTRPRGATGPLRMARVQEFMRSEEKAPGEVSEAEESDPEVFAQKQALTILAGLLFEEPKAEAGAEGRGRSVSALTRGKPDAAGRPRMYLYLGQAIDLQTRGLKPQAAKELSRAIQDGLDHPAAHYNLGLLKRDLKDFEAARKHLAIAAGHPELGLGANLALGRLAKEQGDMPEAARYLLQALRIADSLSVDGSQSAQLSQLYDTILTSQTEGDAETLARIIENTLNFLSGPGWMSRLRQAREQLETQRPGGEVVPIAEMLAVPGTARVIQSISRIEDLLAGKHTVAAMEEAMLALQYAPTYLPLHLRIAEILIATDRLEAGLKKMASVAETYRVRGEIAQATDIYARILSLSPVDLGARAQLIELLAQQDRAGEALGQYLELAELYRQMADIDMARKTLSDALRLAQRSTVDRSWSLKILHEMADIDLSRLDWRRALRVFEQIRTIDPDDDKARSHVIDLNLRLGQEDQAAKELDSYLEHLVQAGRSAEALGKLEELAREHPGKQALHARLAEAYRAAGRIADAIAQYDALGEIQLDAGRVQEAIRTIQTIIGLNPPDVEGYQELLQNLQASA